MGYYKAYYFIYFVASAALFPFLSLHYQATGLSGRQIGLLNGIAPILVMVSAPFWGGLADATRREKALLIGASLAGIGSALLISAARSFSGFLLASSAFAFCAAPILPLVDSSAVEALGERRGQYGRLRLWGSIGWGLSAPLLGLLIDRAGLPWAFYSYALLASAGLLVAWRLPVTQATLGIPFWTGLRLLAGNRRWLVFSGMALLGGFALAVYTNYLFLYMNDIGASKTMMGVALAAATVSELPVFFTSEWLILRFTGPGLLRLALLGSVLRALAYSVIQIPWMVMPVQLLHGLTFAALWAGGVAWARQIAPPGMGATAQGLFGSLVFGLGAGFGGLAGGWLYQELGSAGMFRWTGVIVLVGFLLFSLAQRVAGSQRSAR